MSVESSGNLPLLWLAYNAGQSVASSGNLPLFWMAYNAGNTVTSSGNLPIFWSGYLPESSSGSFPLFMIGGGSPGSCTVVSGYPLSGSTIEQSGFWHNWLDPQNAAGEYDQYFTYPAVGGAGSGIPSQILLLKNFNFNIPTDSQIHGVTFYPLISGIQGGSYDSGVYDYDVKLYFSGQSISNNKGISDLWPPNILTQRTYGGNSDVWGAYLTPEIINNSEFGVGVSIIHNEPVILSWFAGAIYNATLSINYCFPYLNVSGQIPLYTIAHEPSSGNLDLYLLGHEYSSGQFPLYLPGQYFSGDVPLYISGPNPYSGNVDLYTYGNETASGSIPLYIQGPLPYSSIFPLFLNTLPNEYPSGTLTLYLHSPSGTESGCGDPNVYQLITRGFGLGGTYGIFTAGLGPECTSGAPVSLYDAAGYMPLYMYGYEPPISSEMNLFLKGQKETFGSVDLFLKNSYVANSGSIILYLGVQSGEGIPYSSTMSLYMSRDYEGIDDRMYLYLQAGSTNSGWIDLFIQGGGYSGLTIPMYIYGRPQDSGSLTCYIRGY